VTGKASTAGAGRGLERRRAVALARHCREFEGLSIRQIADRLGRSPATVKAYFYDPTGDKARAVKARYVGVCRGCGAYTQPRNGKGDAYAYCKACHPGAIERRWTRERVLDAMRSWRALYGQLPSSYDWSRTHARRRNAQALERLRQGDWPSATVVSKLYGSWAAARDAAQAVADAVEHQRNNGCQYVPQFAHNRANRPWTKYLQTR
jgi:AcrR family transcriptional regulator